MRASMSWRAMPWRLAAAGRLYVSNEVGRELGRLRAGESGVPSRLPCDLPSVSAAVVRSEIADRP
jgi:hypothetical protein